MFYYFGRKGRAASSYPAPEYPLVIEPFAGSMAYTLHWRPKYAIGIEKDTTTFDLWHRLCEMSVDELRNFPRPVVGERSEDRWVIQSAASSWTFATTYRTVTEFMIDHFGKQQRLALQHHDYAGRSVIYRHGDYTEAPDVEATWFIDPPYQGVKDGYRHKDIDYEALAEWCLSRQGQVIICEGPAGAWLPFHSHQGRFAGVPNVNNTLIVERVLTHRTHRRCEVCATTFPAKRSNARFCSARCRQRSSRSKLVDSG